MTDMVPRRWLDLIRVDLESRSRAAVTANEFLMGAAAYRTAQTQGRFARWVLARLDQIEHGGSLLDLIDKREAEAARHPQVTWINAINGNSESRCFTDPGEAISAAISHRPYNNTRLAFAWCTEKHENPEGER